MESSRRELYNDMAEHTSILKNDKKKYYPRFNVTPKTSTELPKAGVSFLLWWHSNNYG